MDNGLKKSLSILGHEGRLQIITVSSFFLCLLVSICMVKLAYPTQAEYANSFMVLYMVIVGGVLPWQLNTKGHISPGYCRYHLSLPVRSWQLYALPLIFRLLLVFLFFAVAYGVFMLFYHCHNGGYYLNMGKMYGYLRIAVLIYLVLQAYGWSKDSVKNLYLYIGIACAVCVLTKPAIIGSLATTQWFYLTFLVFAGLAVVGVRNLRNGNIIELPGLQALRFAIKLDKSVNEKIFMTPAKAHFYQEWKRTCFFMPLLSLLVLIIQGMLLMKRWSMVTSYSVRDEGGILLLAYIAIAIVIPVFGLIYMETKSAGSRYVNNLPISSKALAEIKVKCFACSYALNLAVYIIYVVCRLLFSAHFLEGIRQYNAVLVQSPGYIVWFVAAFIIWSYGFAFLIVILYMKPRLLSLVLVSGMVLYANYTSQIYNWFKLKYYISYKMFVMQDELPEYLPIAFLIFLVIIAKCVLLYLKQKNPFIKVAAVFVVALLTAVFIYLSNFLAILALIPFIMLLCYPVQAYKNKIFMERHELKNLHHRLPWKMITAVTTILLIFSVYTLFLDKSLQRRQNVLYKKCLAYRDDCQHMDAPVTLRDYVKNNFPNHSKLLAAAQVRVDKWSADNAKYKKRYAMWYRARKSYEEVLGSLLFLNNEMHSLIKQGKYARAFDYYLYRLQIVEKFIFDGNYHTNIESGFRDIMQHYNPTREQLKNLKFYLRNILHNKLVSKERRLLRSLERFEKYNYSSSLLGSNISRHTMVYRGYSMSDFTDLYLRPFYFIDRINRMNNTLTVLKSLNYARGGTEQDIMDLIFYPRSVLGQINNYDEISKMQKLIVRTAVDEYCAKYGKEPDALSELVPEFVNSHELVKIFDGSFVKHGNRISYNWPARSPRNIATRMKTLSDLEYSFAAGKTSGKRK